MIPKPDIHLVSSHSQLPEDNKSATILMVASGKGGVGKTWFSVTLAQSLAAENKKILLFDGDLGLANVDIQLGLMPEKDLGTVIAGHCSLKEAVTHYTEGNFDILAGRSGCGSLSQLSTERFWALLQSLKNLSAHYDYLILDVGAGIGDTVKSMARFADHCLVVVTDEPTSLTDAYALIKITHQSHPDLRLSIVVNQAESKETGQRVFDTLQKVCQNFLKYQPALVGIIHKDSRVKESIRAQMPLLTRFQNSVAAKDVHFIATLLKKDKKNV